MKNFAKLWSPRKILLSLISSLILLSPNKTKVIEMADNKLKESLELAKKMDKQGAEAAQDQRADEVKRFLDVISMIESSGGKNFDHKMLESGIHEGHRAIGHYGLMPNTVREVSNRLEREERLPEFLRQYPDMQAGEMKKALERQPDAENYLASELANKVLTQYGDDEEKAAYGWFQGHNISPESMEKRPYKEHEYVKRYNRFKKKLFGE